MSEDESSVRVAVRIRPQLAREVIDMCRVCTSVTPGEPQVTIGSDKSFTYDYVFDTDSDQETIFKTTVAPLVAGSLNGYNATVLAYGQTGSGKTYSMGTGFEVETHPEQTGIIPRAIHMLFNGISDLGNQALSEGQAPPQFKVTAQFLELYNEDIFDLFDSSHEYKAKSNIKIHEDSEHSIYVTGVKSERVGSAEEALSLLKKGALSRTTAATQMNCQSSRSHAIFTLHIRQQRLVQVEAEEEVEERGQQEFETLTAKFHFVDLAGSERLKRTGATGDRAKEGIAINCGLLALGNVISALGDKSKRALHVPYRDSKLTRLLQDSLGGNSRTLMIACVSPSDRDFMETLNTLKYANRARNIQNKVVINQDKSSRTISLLKKEIQQLQLELLEYKQGKRIIGEDGNEAVNDMFHENRLLQSELEALRSRVKGMQDVIDSLTARNTELLAEREIANWTASSDGTKDDMSQMIKGYLTEIENLRTKLVESESIVVHLRKEISRAHKFSPRNDNSSLSESGIEEVLDIAKKDVQKDLETIKSQQIPAANVSPSDSESSSSDGEEDAIAGQYSADIAEITSEITIKQRLIEALENTNKRLNLMKQQYEEKLLSLQAKILATEKERDTVLASYSNIDNKPSEKVKKIKDEYEKKLYDMQKEMKSLLSAKKEHAKLLKNQSQYENQIKLLTSEVSDMKRTKVKLIKKMQEEAKKYKEVETRRNREIAQLKKKTRQDASMIKTLEAERKAKAIVLKRKQEEVSALRKAAQGRKFGRRHHNQASQAKHHWVSLEKTIAEIAMSRHNAISLEKEMEKKIEQRTELQEELNNKLAMLNDPRFSNSSVLGEEVDSVRANLDHVQSAISDLQHEILQLEESKSAYESDDLLRHLVDLGEAPYMLEKLYSMALNQSCVNAEKDATLRELQAENEQLKRESEMQEQLLKHLVEGKGSIANESSPPSNDSSRSPSPLPENKKKRHPKKALAPFDLLFPPNAAPNSDSKKGSSSAAASPERIVPPPLLRSLTTIRVPSSAPGSPNVIRKGMTVSPKLTRKNTYVLTSSTYPSMERGLDFSSSPPGSPPVYRRQTSREENVFSRLTSQQPSLTRHPGKITSFTFRKNQRNPIFCTHVVEGHSRAVLAIHATEENLFTASRDRSVLVWDLRQMKELCMFGNHPNNVVAIKYEPGHNLVFAASSSLVKVWDLRSSKCIRTLFSSGMTTSWSNQQNNNNTDPQINDIALAENGQALYTAAGDKVRVWDLRKFSVSCKLIGGHQAAVMCLAVGPDVVVTGSKDHYIKLFDIDSEGKDAPMGVLTPRTTLEPPHYDGIQCLQLSEGVLFSGSRDGIIKKWNTQSCELLCSLNGAHKDWVTGLCKTNTGLLASGCRDGTVKLWSPDTCACIGEVKAHSSGINALASNSSHLFTASNSGDVMIWKETCQEQDIMTMSTGHMLQLSL